MTDVQLDARQRLLITTPYAESGLLHRCPDRRLWDARQRVWIVTPSRSNIMYLDEKLPRLDWAIDARKLADDILQRGQAPALQNVDDYVFADPPPWAHQRHGLALSRVAPAFGLLMEQRTGKTRIIIDTATDLFLKGKIDLAVVICPNSVKDVWAEQIVQWTPRHVTTDVIIYSAGTRKQVAARLTHQRPGALQWLIINVDAFSTAPSVAWVKEQIMGRCMLGAIDEVTRIKSPSAARTKALLKMRHLFAYRRILTGTLVTQSPLDVYAPFYWLDPAILGYSSFYAFRNDYAIMGGWHDKQVVGFINIEKLATGIKPFSYRVRRDDVFDQPPKIYTRLEVDLAPEQRRIYDEMRTAMVAELSNLPLVPTTIYDEARDELVEEMKPQRISTTMIITQMMRLQQITGGFTPNPDPKEEPLAIPGPNPKLDALLEALEEETGKVIIWARFIPEVRLIAAALRNRYGLTSTVEFYGATPMAERTRARQLFSWNSTDETTRFLVGQQQTGGLGTDFAKAALVVYFSNTFSLEDRLQTEDRSQNGNKHTATGYLDLYAKNTRDAKIIGTLRNKRKLADVVNGDNWKEWI